MDLTFWYYSESYVISFLNKHINFFFQEAKKNELYSLKILRFYNTQTTEDALA